MACTEDTIGRMSNALRIPLDEDGNVTLDQYEYFKQLRPIQHPEWTSADADAQATKMVADMFASLRGAL
eukprot:1146571-Pyramimonas_sp.AAC.1